MYGNLKYVRKIYKKNVEIIHFIEIVYAFNAFYSVKIFDNKSTIFNTNQKKTFNKIC